VERGEREFSVPVPPSACFDVVADFESYPEWQSAIVECRVLERDADGRGSLIETIVDAKVRKVRYVLRYAYEPPHRVSWSFVEGDPKDVSGEFVFEDDGSGGTAGVYRQAIDPGGLTRFVPGPVKKGLLELLLDRPVNDLSERVAP
jgi:ribosome-associated toxin RatA of RatAB toxin-antitoxin module